MAAEVSASKIRQDITGILKGADLSSLSSKKIRKQLEEKYGTDLTERKKEIDSLVMEAITAQQKKEEEEDEGGSGEDDVEDEETAQNGETQTVSPRKTRRDSDSDFSEPEDVSPPKKKAKSGKVDDAELAKKLQEEEIGSQRRSTRSGKTPPAKNKKKTPKAATVNKSKGRTGKGYGQPCVLSPQLADIMGTDKMARSDVVKRMWEIIKARNLADPKNKQFMICDPQLLTVFGRKRVKTFGMMKYLSNHIFKPGELDDMLTSSH